jgi:hypothetical protein
MCWDVGQFIVQDLMWDGDRGCWFVKEHGRVASECTRATDFDKVCVQSWV